MNKSVGFIVVLIVLMQISCTKGSFTLNRDKISTVAIIIPDNANSIVRFAAEELKKHLDLVFEGDIKITGLSDNNKFTKEFYVGIKPDSFKNQPKPEEAFYIIRKKSIYLFGGDEINISYSDDNRGELNDRINSEVLNLAYNRTGSLFAVYCFLENELGIKWIKPGDEGIFYSKRANSTFSSKEYLWTPSLIQRNIRTGAYTYKGQALYGKYAPNEFQMTEYEAINKQTQVLTWMRRMRMGRSENFRFGHAYTKYWEKYKDTNPEIFALNGKGARKPLRRIERVKMCPTNPDLPKIVVNEWKDNALKNRSQESISISGCENDSDGIGNDEWCHCDKCMAIDARREGEELTDYVTDRYVYLWNAILKEARKYKNDIMVTGYAYENMLQAPRKEKLDDGILIEFIPRMGGDFEKTKNLYEGWQSAGMTKMMYRPNDMNWEIGIPMGQEERLFNNYNLAIKHNAIGTDFDSMLGYWEGISDITYFILAKGQADPQASFEKLENEFLSSFGDAKNDISQYYLHWRNIFNNKIMPEELKLNDGINTYFLEWHRLYRLTDRIDDFYSISDFDITDSFLKNALEKDISEQVKNYIKRMQIANEHSRLTYISFIKGKIGNKDQIVEAATNLINFRIANRDKIDINWNVLFQSQHYQMDDQIGTRFLGYLPNDLDSDNF